MKFKEIIKQKTFWGYILTGIGSFLAGSGDIISFVTGLIGWFQ